MKTATLQGKLDRINDQIAQAQGQVKVLNTQIEDIEKALVAQLSKVSLDEEGIDALESKRSELIALRDRLAARAQALRDTIPDAQAAIDAARLSELTEEHERRIEAVGDALAAWREQAKIVQKLQDARNAVIAARKAAKRTASEIYYLSELLGKERPELPEPGHITREEVGQVREAVRVALMTSLDPYFRNEWDEKLKALQDAERIQMREQRHKEAVAAG